AAAVPERHDPGNPAARRHREVRHHRAGFGPQAAHEAAGDDHPRRRVDPDYRGAVPHRYAGRDRLLQERRHPALRAAQSGDCRLRLSDRQMRKRPGKPGRFFVYDPSMTDAASARITTMVAADPWAMDILRIARRLALPDWAIGAGFLRGLVWDRLCGFASRTPLNDIDIVYFDTTDTGRDRENAAEAQLHAWRPDQVWSVRNMARMHLRNGDASYRDTEDAISHWLET